MSWGYFDTSALVKRYVDEPGRQEVMQLFRRHECVGSALVAIELQSALRRRIAEGTIDGGHVADIVKRFRADRTFWTLVEVTREVVVAAETLVAASPLRTLDAIHLASAQLFVDRTGEDVVFVSADRRQVEVALRMGMTTKLIA